MLDNPGVYFDVTPFIHGRCKTPVEEIQAAVDGAMSPAHAVKLRECMSHIDQLESHKRMVEQDILRLSAPYGDELALIRTVPGFDKNPMTAITILSEIGADMSVFPSAKHLVSWAGCCPRNDQSAKKIKSTRISCRSLSKASSCSGRQRSDQVQASSGVQGTLPEAQSPPWSQESYYRNLQDAPDRYLERP